MTPPSPGILYADADEEARSILPQFLARCGPLRVTGTLAQAPAAAAAVSSSVLVVDPALPDGDGAELIAAVHARHPWVQIMVVCGRASAERTSLFIAAGANDVAPARRAHRDARHALRHRRPRGQQSPRVHPLQRRLPPRGAARRRAARR